MKVYVLLFGFWEGDGYLVESYVDVFTSLEEARDAVPDSSKKVYLPGDKSPQENDGGYGWAGFYRIVEKEL